MLSLLRLCYLLYYAEFFCFDLVLPLSVPAQKLENFLLVCHYLLPVLALGVGLGHLNWVMIDGFK